MVSSGATEGEGHWKEGRSVLELARAWFPSGRGPAVPRELGDLLDAHTLTSARHATVPEKTADK